MLTLAEAAKLTNDVLQKGIIETIIKESPMLSKLPFKDIVGNGLTYNREATMPGAEFYSVGDTWAESTGTRTQYTAKLTILGGDADVDEFEKQTMSDQNDLESITIEEKAKAVSHAWDHEVVYGDVDINPKGFDGLHKLVDPSMMVHASASNNGTGAALSLAKLDEMIDLIKPGRPDCLMMTKTMRRRIKQFYRGASTGGFHQEVGEDGKLLEFYGDIPIVINDFMTFTESIDNNNTYVSETGGATSSIFALKFGEKLLAGLQNGGIQKKRIGELQSKDAVRWRIKWYCGLALFNIYALARIDGITNAAVTA